MSYEDHCEMDSRKVYSNKTEVFFVHFLTCLLEENNYFEDAFKVYERGVKTFKYPHVKDIWVRQSWSVPEFVRV